MGEIFQRFLPHKNVRHAPISVCGMLRFWCAAYSDFTVRLQPIYAQGPSFSPDGRWVAFTAYLDKYGDAFGCEIYIMRVAGKDRRRLTNNDYCDYQPRWGP